MIHLRRGTRSLAGGRRWLSFELLERRDLLAVLRIVDWNTANHPKNAQDITDFTTILQAIGNETVAGNTKRLDILALQETDFSAPGGSSIAQIETILEGLYAGTNYSFTVSTEDGGGDATGYVYDTSTVSLLDAVTVSPALLTHDIRRAKFRPADTLGESDFYVYSVHLKADDSGPGSDAATRGDEALVLRADADSLGEGTNVLIVGDFNMKTSAEPAYANLLAAGAGQLFDVAGAPGNWNGNAAFKTLHSQAPGANMDDRFDIHFASGEFFDDFGLDYVTGSYHVFGNNGTHTLGQPITTGSGASPTVLTALANASDHLPVIADYEVIASTPNVRITQTAGNTKVIEGGLADTYYVVLDTAPSANVTVTVAPNTVPVGELDVLGNGTSNPRDLIFTPTNWPTPQVVVVRAINDTDAEGNHTSSITHTSASTDLTYSGLTIAGVSVNVVDNDAPTIVINEFDADQPSTPVNDNREFIELYDGGVGNASLTGYIIVFFNGSDDNDGSYQTFDLMGRSTDANGYFVLGNSGVPGVDMTFNNNSLQNGPADAVALYLASAASFPGDTSPTTTNLRDAIVYGVTATDDPVLRGILTPGQPLVNENENDQSESQSVSRVPDGGLPLVTTTYRAQAPTPDAANQPVTPGVLIVHSGTRVDISESGAIDSYQIALLTIPTSDVTITVDSDGQSQLTGAAGPGLPIMLTFTPANALIPQLVTVTAVDDLAPEGAHTSVITHMASGGGFNGAVIGNVVANITDNDFALPPMIVITELMYNPSTPETGAALPEWIEVVNAGSAAVDLGGWVFDDGDAGNWDPIPLGTVLNPGQIAVFFDETIFGMPFSEAAMKFRTDWSVPFSALVVGIGWAGMANDPDATDAISLLDNTAMVRDLVAYDDSTPWPTDNGLASIYLKALTLDNNAGASWARSAAGVARAVSPTGSTFLTSDIGSPGRFFLPGDYNVNGYVDTADYVLWRDTLGSADLRADGSGPTVGTPNGVVDQADYNFWRANFGNVGAYYSGGSGAGAGDGESGSVASPAVVAEASEPVRFEQAGSSNDGLAVDAAVIELSLIRSQSLPSFAGRSVSRTGSVASGAADMELLLVVERAVEMERHDKASDAIVPGSSEDVRSDVDEFFASLDAWDIAAVGTTWN